MLLFKGARTVPAVLLAAFFCLAVAAASAGDHILTIGGGYAPSGNQVSLEKNVIFFRQVLAELKLDHVPHDVLFSDGDSPGRDVQYFDPSESVPRVNQLLARVFGDEKHLEHHY